MSLDLLYSIRCEGQISNTSMKLMCSDFWWNLMNDISKYLFLEQLCQFSEGVLKFLSEAGDSIHSFSSCTHTGALKTEWKCRISLKSAYLYTSIVHCTLALYNFANYSSAALSETRPPTCSRHFRRNRARLQDLIGNCCCLVTGGASSLYHCSIVCGSL